MLLTIATSHPPATDLGFLLHKHPDRVHTVALAFGTATVVYPEAGPEWCRAALVVDVDPVALVRGRAGHHGRGRSEVPLGRYINDRPYAASSLLSVAIGACFGTALGGRSRERPDLAATPLPLVAELPVVPCRGGEALVRRLFEPLGYEVTATGAPLDPRFPAWGDSPYLALRLAGRHRIQTLLQHLTVLLPVLDDDKHYWVGPDEVDKLGRRAGEWLGGHPERTLVAARYLRHDRTLVDDALSRLADDGGDPGAGDTDTTEDAAERPLRLADLRLEAVVDALRDAGARRVADLGCGEGRLVGRLLREPWVDSVLGLDVSPRALAAAARRLHLDAMAPRQRARVELAQGSLTYRDHRLASWDAAVLAEVIEHVDPGRLAALEQAVWGHARPATVVVTTPNADYNPRLAGLAPGARRHRDHRFEWGRDRFASWVSSVSRGKGYRAEITGIGAPDPALGSPTQMAVFCR